MLNVIRLRIFLPSGEVEDIKVTKPSQYEAFNTQSVSSIQAASPFPSLPARYFKDSLTVEIPLDFQPYQDN